MKKLLLTATMLMVLASCGRPNISPENTKYKLGPTGNIALQVVDLEGCEYFFCQETSVHFSLTHKGNCKNPIHKQK